MILKLIRIESPTGYLLCFFPACYGLLLESHALEELKILPLFFIGSIVVRSAGCIVNDIFDRKYDIHVHRTKERPLATKQISVKLALTILAILSIAGAAIMLCLSELAIYLCMIAVTMTGLYPLMKRITYFPQIFLGFTFNMGVLIAYATVKNSISIESSMIYVGCCFWTIGFDTIYGFADIEDDERIGVRSLSILLKNRKYKYYIGLCYIIFITLFYIANYRTNYMVANNTSFNLCVFASTILLLYQVITLDIRNPIKSIANFKISNYVGAFLFASAIIVK
ncbi:MAG: 4-hydroxybenzoate octaprenyltransferase [Janthinobacterium lividum]